MEKTIKRFLVATGLIASAAVALLPLTSYAAQTVTGPIPGISDTGYAHGYACNDNQSGNECARATQNGSTEVVVNVDTVLAIDAFSLTCSGSDDICHEDEAGSKVIQAYPGLVRTGTLTATVRSAKPFTISLSAEEPYLMGYDSEGKNTGVIIPASDVIDGVNNGWGIQKTGETGYTKVTTRPVVFYDSGSSAQDAFADFDFTVGVSANSNIPQGFYSTEVTVTAATKATDQCYNKQQICLKPF